MENGSKTERTLGDLTPSELIALALPKVSEAIEAHEQDTPGPACGAYAYLHLAKSKLDQEQGQASPTGTEWTVRSRYETTDGDRVTLLYAPGGDRFAVSYSYEWGNPPQLVEYADRLNAHRAFAVSLQNATRRGAVLRGEG